MARLDNLSKAFLEYAKDTVPDYVERERTHGRYYHDYVIFLGGDGLEDDLKQKLKNMRSELLKQNPTPNNEDANNKKSKHFDEVIHNIHSCLAPQGIRDPTLRAVIAIWAAKGPIQESFNTITEEHLVGILDWPTLKDHRDGNFYVKTRAAYIGESLNRTIECYHNLHRGKSQGDSWKTFATNMTISAAASNIPQILLPFLFLHALPLELVNNIAKIHTDFHMKGLMAMADIAMSYDPNVTNPSANMSVNAMNNSTPSGRWQNNPNRKPAPMKIKWDQQYPNTCFRCHDQKHGRGIQCPRMHTKCNYCNRNGHIEDACFKKAQNDGREIPIVRRHQDDRNRQQRNNRTHVQNIEHDAQQDENDGYGFGRSFETGFD